MAARSDILRRCAIYTRKSTEHGLELEFNSLDAQREACEAYIKSQASEGWRGLPQRYDDPAYSGGNMERPALRRLLKDIDSGLVDVVVVYKIDRLTRSLADFAKLVEIFDRKGISFVAVTQQFNTTTSMGRLTLNVLLSFAQFERELSSERVRDKVAASRRKGKWMGGSVPLGYDRKDKKLVINAAEAKTVNMIFSRYLALQSFSRLVEELDRKGVVSKKRDVDQASAVPFRYGALAYLLKNRTYIGESGHKGSWFPGEHEPIVDRATFEQVQLLLKTNSIGRARERHDTQAMVGGIIFDDRGNRMSSSFAMKRGVRYQYYISTALLRGRKQEAGSIARIAAPDLENAVLKVLRSRLHDPDGGADLPPRELIDHAVERVVVGHHKITISLKPQDGRAVASIEIPWSIANKSKPHEIEGIDDIPSPNSQLVQAVVRAHAWIRGLANGTYETIDELAQAINLHPKIVRNQIRIGFLAPEITEAILQGGQPPGMSLNDFKRKLPLCWSAQRRAFRMDTV